MTGADSPAPAVRSTVRAVGETIASSAGTVIVGVAMMATAELGLYNTSGPSLAIAVAIALLAGLTLTPAMLRVLGHHAFWPRNRPPRKDASPRGLDGHAQDKDATSINSSAIHATEDAVLRRPVSPRGRGVVLRRTPTAHRMKEAGIWSAWAGKVVKRPWIAFLIPVIVLVPLAWYGSGLGRDFDLLADLPKDNEQRLGFDVLAAHFGAGQMQPLNIVVVNPDGAGTPAGLTQARDLENKLAALPHVAMIRSLLGSLPDPETLNVADQLATVKKSVDDGTTAIAQALDGSDAASNRGGPMSAAGSATLQASASQLKAVAGYLVQIAQSYPDATQNSGYVQAIGALSQLATLGQQFSSGSSGSSGATDVDPAVIEQALAQLKGISQGLGTLQEYFATRQPDAILLPDLYLQSNSGLKALRDAYLSADGTAARLQVVLDSGPYSPEAIAAVQAIEKTLDEFGVEGYVEGNSAVLLDLREASNRDMTKAFIFVLGGIFVVLLLLLRALVAPIYLILTILLSYAGTLGVMRLIFVNIMHTGGVTWWVPMFMFVMLVALGMDYNIFLIGRVKEEVATSGTREGTRHALARTGGIITSAGIIMAGTFASMMSGSILGLLQIGFAVAFGVLLDTFVVRTTLVPAIIVLLGRWSWWPRRGPAGHKPVGSVDLPPSSERPSISE